MLEASVWGPKCFQCWLLKIYSIKYIIACVERSETRNFYCIYLLRDPYLRFRIRKKSVSIEIFFGHLRSVTKYFSVIVGQPRNFFRSARIFFGHDRVSDRKKKPSYQQINHQFIAGASSLSCVLERL